MLRHSFALLMVVLFINSMSAQSFFKRTDERKISLRSNDERTIIPTKYEVFTLDVAGIKTYLRQTPMEFSGLVGLPLEIPMPDGSLEMFEVFEAPSMEPELSAKFPSIRSYKGVSHKDRSTSVRFAVGPNGFYAAIESLDGEKYIDPYSEKNTDDYIVYNVKDHRSDIYDNISMCGVEGGAPESAFHETSTLSGRTDIVDLRIFRLAMACTGEWGRVARRGTVEKCLADMNTMLTRMNAIYERELSLRFVLVAENDKLIFLDANTDPYNNSNEGKKILPTNTRVINGLLTGGAGAYDIGHVLSICYDIGGVAQLGSACQSNKGNGVTCNNNNDLSNIVTRVMAHEVGHQFDAAHTWNICSDYDDQRSGSWAYEPGSGTTIMSYAGSCDTDDVTKDNDDYFHVASLFQMYKKTNIGGNAYSCSQKVPTNNHFPTVTVPAVTYTIPISTPFALSGSGTDEDNDKLTYCWEQYDLGDKVALGTISDKGPLFRSYKPATNGDIRFIPKANNILSGNYTDKTEPLPDLARSFTFRLTVRDNNAEAGGVVWDECKVEVTDKAGPFKLIFPELDERFKTGQLVNILWDVANTDKAPVNCQKVNIYGSFSAALRDDDPNLVPLALDVPNNGSANVIIPNRISNFFRIVIKAADNIFLVSSKLPSRIEEATEPNIYVVPETTSINICQPDTGFVNFITQALGGFEGKVGFLIDSDLPAGITAVMGKDTIVAGEINTLIINTNQVVGSVSGTITVKTFADGVDTIINNVDVFVEGGNIDFVKTISPEAAADNTTTLPKFFWNSKPDAISYEIQIATNPDFIGNSLVAEAIVADTTYIVPTLLKKSTIYYWRVRGNNNCKSGEWSEIRAFLTEVSACSELLSGTMDITIGVAKDAIAEIPLSVTLSGNVSDVNIGLIKATHGRLSDLSAYLVSPSGTEALLWSKKCANQQNVRIGLDDQSPDFFQCPINTGKLYRTDVSGGAAKLDIFNGEPMQGQWILRLVDGVAGIGGKLEEFNLEICANLTPQDPFIITNKTLDLKPGDKTALNNTWLEVGDNDNGPTELVFTIVTLPQHAEMLLNGLPLAVGSTFTQDDLNGWRLRYDSDATYEGPDAFTFTVFDGAGGWLGITTFNVNADNDNKSTSVDDTNISNDVFVSPNPTTEVINIALTGKASNFKTYRLSDLSGRIVTEGSLSGKNTSVDLRSINKGIYLLHLSDGRLTATKKVIRM